MDNTDPTRPTPPPAPTLAPVAAPPAALVVPGGWQIEGLPDIVRRAIALGRPTDVPAGAIWASESFTITGLIDQRVS